jgi:hypothetical protein
MGALGEYLSLKKEIGTSLWGFGNSDQIGLFQSLKYLIDKSPTGGFALGKATVFLFILIPPDAGPAVLGRQDLHQIGDFRLR